MNRTVSFLIYGIIVLGAIGLLSQLFTNPIYFIKNTIILALTIGIVILIVKRLTKSKPAQKEQRAFIKAARDSKKRNKTRDISKGKKDNLKSFSLANNLKKTRSKNRADVHLTVIEGKKGKKKNRALF